MQARNFVEIRTGQLRRRIRKNVDQHLEDIASGASSSDAVASSNDASFNYSQAVLHSHHCSANDSLAEASTAAEIYELRSQSDDLVASSCDAASCSLSDNSSDKLIDDSNLRENLKEWANRFEVKQDALGLLQILKPLHPTLPKDPRTLQDTPRRVKLKQFEDKGSYYHFGVKNAIMKHFSEGSIDKEYNYLSVQVNVDGVPLFKSSNYQLWPILGILQQSVDHEPFIIGIYAGNSKPLNIEEYLHDFVEEMKSVEQDGLLFHDVKYTISIHSFVCDAPARSFLKCIKSHTRYYACERCMQRGIYSSKMTFPETTACLRSDENFKQMTQEEHHIRASPLTHLSIGLVSDFVLDYMHLVCLGVTRRLIATWTRGPLTTRLPEKCTAAISERLLNLESYIPCEFARKPRALSELDRWKGTEFRQFLLYTGPVVLRKMTAPQVYNNFLLLSVAIRCLCSAVLYSSHCGYAQNLLVAFVEHAGDLYGKDFMVYNVHSLVHVADDVRKFGPLDTISAFPFENRLKKLKKMVRKSHLPLQQIVKRVFEREHLEKKKPRAFPAKSCHKQHYNGPTVSPYDAAVQYSTYKSASYTIKLRKNDNCILMNDGEIGLAQKILELNSHVYLLYSKFAKIQNSFDYPLASGDIGMFLVSALQSAPIVRPVQDVACKCVCLPDENQNFTVLSLLHHERL